MEMTKMGSSMGEGNRQRPDKLYENSDEYEEKTLYGLKLDTLTSKLKTPQFIYILTFFSALGGFLFGYDTGVISGAMILLRNTFLLSSVWQELVVSVTIAGAAVFAIVGGILNDRIGRRPTIMIASVVFTVGAFCMGLAPDKYVLLGGRIIIGAGIVTFYRNYSDHRSTIVSKQHGLEIKTAPCLISMTIPVYLAECAPSHVRGRIVSTNIAMVAGGQFVANVVDGIFGFNEESGWRYMLGLAGLPSAIQFIGFIFMPESPRWLITQNREDEARLVLQKMRGYRDIEEELESIKASCQEAELQEKTRAANKPIILQMIRTPATLRALIVGCSLQLIQQVAGINTVMYYSATIIRMSGVKSDEAAIWLSAVTAAVNFCFTLVGIYLVEKIGRRALTLGSLLGAVISLAWLAVGFYLSSQNTPPVSFVDPSSVDTSCATHKNCNQCMRDLYCGYCYMDTFHGAINSTCLPADYDNPWLSTRGRCNSTYLPGQLTWAYDYCPTPYAWMPMVGLVLYLIFFAPGMGPMPWTINSEIYPLWARSTGNAAATFTNWFTNLIVSMSFLSLTEVLTRYGTFWLYTTLALLGGILLAFILPETKGKTLEEVEGVFAKSWCASGPSVPSIRSIQYVHIRGLNRDGRESELESP